MPVGGAAVADNSVVSLTDVAATPHQRRILFAVAAILLAAFAATVPFAAVQLPTFVSFNPSVESIVFANDLITAILLYSQYAITRSRAILALAVGYLYGADRDPARADVSRRVHRPARRSADQRLAVLFLERGDSGGRHRLCTADRPREPRDRRLDAVHDCLEHRARGRFCAWYHLANHGGGSVSAVAYVRRPLFQHGRLRRQSPGHCHCRNCVCRSVVSPTLGARLLAFIGDVFTDLELHCRRLPRQATLQSRLLCVPWLHADCLDDRADLAAARDNEPLHPTRSLKHEVGARTSEQTDEC